jgi:AcrR family transcriptional regulator
MSKEKISTKEKIVAKALEMYNTHGIEYAGVRELAKELDMKGGNITYYFPTKNDLIRELTQRLSDTNEALLSQEKETSIYNFLDMHRSIYSNQYQYRALFISLPLLLKQDNEFARQYAERQVARKKAIYRQLKSLFLAGYFQTAKAQDLDTILHAITTTNRFWISEATVDEIIEDRVTAINTYINRLAGLLHIIATDKGKEEIKRFSSELT